MMSKHVCHLNRKQWLSEVIMVASINDWIIGRYSKWYDRQPAEFMFQVNKGERDMHNLDKVTISINVWK